MILDKSVQEASVKDFLEDPHGKGSPVQNAPAQDSPVKDAVVKDAPKDKNSPVDLEANLSPENANGCGFLIIIVICALVAFLLGAALCFHFQTFQCSATRAKKKRRSPDYSSMDRRVPGTKLANRWFLQAAEKGDMQQMALYVGVFGGDDGIDVDKRNEQDMDNYWFLEDRPAPRTPDGEPITSTRPTLADIDYCEPNRERTAMHIATTTGNVPMLEFLMKNDASPYIKTSGKTPLQVVPDNKPGILKMLTDYERDHWRVPCTARAKRKWGSGGVNFFKWLACQYARPEICDSCEWKRDCRE